jgi:hypothetical protein
MIERFSRGETTDMLTTNMLEMKAFHDLRS